MLEKSGGFKENLMDLMELSVVFRLCINIKLLVECNGCENECKL